MRKLLLMLLIGSVCLFCTSLTFAADDTLHQWNSNSSGFTNTWNNNDTFMKPFQQNGYGLGVHSDAAGKPFQWQTQQGDRLPGFIKVNPNGYGPGIGMDEFGRPVKPTPFGYGQ